MLHEDPGREGKLTGERNSPGEVRKELTALPPREGLPMSDSL